jgi:peptidoglycan/LPS O-acetylase OafA/YrhL
LHLWSLGIEEQFYLLWPLLLMLVVRFRLSILAVTFTLGIASFVLNLALIGVNPVATFYLPFTRAFELLAGAALARGWGSISQTAAASNGRALWASANRFQLACFSHARFRAGGRSYRLVEALYCIARRGHRVVSRANQWYGSRYRLSLYLWHWPLLVFFAIIKFSPRRCWSANSFFGVLAWMTYGSSTAGSIW